MKVEERLVPSPDVDVLPAPIASIDPPEPGLTPEQMIARAAAMRADLRAAQAETERRGNISPEINARFIDNGFYRVVQPRFFGGYEFDVATYVRLVMEVARGCPESAWVLSLTSGHTRQFATFPIEGQAMAYGSTGEFRAPEVTAPPGRAVAVEGGYRISGTWDYASGSAVSTHILVVAIVGTGASNENEPIMALIPRADFQIVKNWQVFGMQGTGSDRVVVDDIFVPASLTRPAFATEGPNPLLPDRRYIGSPLYFGPYRSFVIAESAAVVVGAAEGALDCYEEDFRARKGSFAVRQARHELPEYQFNFGRCRALVDTAKAALLHTAAQYMAVGAAALAGEAVDPEADRRMAMIEQQAIHLAWDAVDIIFRTIGSSAAKSDSTLGRFWRNIGVLRGHLAHQSDTVALNYGRVHFGHPQVGPF